MLGVANVARSGDNSTPTGLFQTCSLQPTPTQVTSREDVYQTPLRPHLLLRLRFKTPLLESPGDTPGDTWRHLETR